MRAVVILLTLAWPRRTAIANVLIPWLDFGSRYESTAAHVITARQTIDEVAIPFAGYGIIAVITCEPIATIVAL
jgi:hypothetical protein